ncbi:hypothetical protein [Micromonospora sp. 4G55]|uniref:hypothetical protein n=1 Tax=Micromonospora sp. 4G55 TaxID=2806102 RepID=UPI001A391D81|nr:hypothetical protein [Micromonospora sp. 4G55]MBM0257374.1 hypothetical protein [Micromonospora sp. 4G55]
MRLHAGVTMALDVLGLLLVAGGVAAGLYPRVGWLCLIVGGLIIVAVSALWSVLRDRRERALTGDEGDAS